MNEQLDVPALLRTIVEEVSERPLGNFDPQTPIAELGIDSVSVAEIVVRVEDALGIEVPVSEWVRVRTMQDFVEVVDHAR